MEDFRIRAQLFFSDTRVVVSFSLLCFLFFMLFFNFAGNLAANGYDFLRASMKAGALKSHKTALLIPGPFILSRRLKWYYLVCGIISMAFSVRVGYLMKVNLSPLSNSKVKGSRHFATILELQNEYRSVPEKTDLYDGPGGFPVARYKDRIFIDDSPVHNLIIGTARSGKGEIFVIPAIDIYSRTKDIMLRASLVVADPKGELACASKTELEQRGYRVYIFDLLSFMGMSFNPLQLVKDAYIRGDRAEAQLLSNTLSYIMFNDPMARDKTWQNWSIALTNALILALVIDCCAEAEKCEAEAEKQLWFDKINMYSVARLLIDLGDPNVDEDSDTPNLVDKFFSQRDFNDIARIQYAAVGLNPMKTKTGIYGNTLAVLNKFTMEPIAKMTAKNSINLEDIGFSKDQPTAVFLVMPDYDTSNQFLATTFITQLYYVLSKKASISPGGQCPREVVFILDEFGNIVPIPDMAHILTVCLGRNIRFDLVIQAYSQIFKLYGEQDGKTIIGNCGNQIYLLTIEEDTAKRISSLIGNKTITVFSRNEKNNLSLDKSLQEHIDTQPLRNPNDLMEFKPGESAIVRITKRTDLQGRKINPSPIYNHDETVMKYRYEYLGDDFDPRRSFQSLHVADQCLHKGIDLSEVLYTPKIEEGIKIKESIVQKADPFLNDILSLQQMELICRFLETSGVDTSEIRWDIVMTTFDNFLQGLFDSGEISHQTFEDVFTVLDQAAAHAERSDPIENAS
jgi:type IV secretion system protein VirD4